MKTTTALLVMALATRGHAHENGHDDDDLVRTAWWTSEAPIPVQLSDMSATTVGSVVYVIGGCDQDQIACDWWDGCSYCPSVTAGAWAYTPADDAWAAVADAPRARYRHAAAAVSDRYIYVLGGRDVDDGLIADVDVLDTSSGSWSTLSSAWAAPRSDLAAFFSSPYVYAVGGYSLGYVAQNTSGVYDVDAGAWVSDDANWAVAPLLEARGDFGIVESGGLYYAIGGWSHVDWCAPLQTVEVYDPSANTWTAVSSLLVGRGDKAVGALHGRIFAIGGEHNNECGASGSTPVHDVEVYDPSAASPAWAVEGHIPEAKFRFASATVGEAIYIFGGQSNVSYSGCVTADDAVAEFCYPVTNHTWAFAEAEAVGGGGGGSDGPAPVVLALIVVVVILVIGGVAAVMFLGKAKQGGGGAKGAAASDASDGEKKNAALDDDANNDDTIELAMGGDSSGGGGGGSDALATTDESDTAPCVA